MGLLGRILLGMGMACNFMGTLKLLTAWFTPTTFATLTGIVYSIGTLGNMAATVPFAFMVDLMGWRLAFMVIAGINLGLVLALYVVVRDTPQNGHGENTGQMTNVVRNPFSGLIAIFKNRTYWIISLTSFTGYGIYAAFQTLWAGPYLTEVMGLGIMDAGQVILLMNVGAIAGGPVWGWLSDRIFHTRKWVVTGSTALVIVILLLLAVLSSATSLVILMVLFLAFGFFRASAALLYVHIKETMPHDMAGTAMTAINFFTMVGPAVFLQGLGIFMQTCYPQSSRGPEAFTASLYLCALLLSLVFVAYLFTKDTSLERNRS